MPDQTINFREWRLSHPGALFCLLPGYLSRFLKSPLLLPPGEILFQKYKKNLVIFNFVGLQTVHLVTIRITAVDSRHVPIQSDWGILGRTTNPLATKYD